MQMLKQHGLMLRYTESWCKLRLVRKKDNFIGTFKGAERDRICLVSYNKVST